MYVSLINVWDKNGLPCITQEAEDIVSKLADEDTIINKLPQIKIYNIGVGLKESIDLFSLIEVKV